MAESASEARRVISGTAVLAAGQLIVRAASLISFPLLANSVDDRTYGVYMFALQMGATWAVFANFQLRVPLVRLLATSPERAAELTGQVLAIRLLLGALVGLAAAAWGLGEFATGREQAIFWLLLTANLTLTLQATFDETLLGLEGFRQSAITAVVNGLLVSGSIIVGVLIGRPIAWAVGGQLAAAAVSLVLTAWLAGRHAGRRLVRWHWDSGLARSMMTLAVGVAVAAQIGAIYGRTDLWLVRRAVTGELLPAGALGHYTVPYRALEVCMAGVMALHTALLPTLARAHDAGPEALAARLGSVLRVGLLVLLPLAVAVGILAPQLMLVFRPQYAAGTAPLAVLIWLTPLTFVAATLHWALYLDGRPWRVTLCMAAGLVVNGLAGSLLLPRLGLLGPALGRVAGETMIGALAAVWLAGRTPVRWGAVLGRPLLMTGLMAATWLACGALAWWLRALLAVAVYLAAGRWLQPLSARERDLLSSLFARRRRGEVSDSG